MKVLCICGHYAEAGDDMIAACRNCGRVWKWYNGARENDWTMIAGPRKDAP